MSVVSKTILHKVNNLQSSNSYFHLGEEADDKFTFHENKAYAIQKVCLAKVETIKEFDLGKRVLFLCFQTMIESMSFQLHTIPNS